MGKFCGSSHYHFLGRAAYDPILPASPSPQFVGHLKVGQLWGHIPGVLLGQLGGLPGVGGRQAKRGGSIKIWHGEGGLR